jgi:hypothetical protein
MADTLQKDGDTFPPQLRQALARAPQPVPARALLLPDMLLRSPSILSSDELSGMWHLPTPRLQGLVRHLPSRYLAVPPEVFVKPGDTERLTFGYARHANGEREAVGLYLDDMREIVHVVAGQGAGKTRLVVNLAQQSVPYGYTFMNGKGDDKDGSASHDIRKLVPRDAEARLVLWNPLDVTWPISCNPLGSIDLGQPGMDTQVLGMVQAVFQRIDPDGMTSGPIMKMLLDMSTLLVVEGGSAVTLAHIEQALIDPSYRGQLLPRLTNPKVRAYWEARREGYSEREQQSLEALLRRFHTLLTSELVRFMVIQPTPLFTFDRAIDQRWIVLIDLPHNTLGPLAGVVGMLLFSMFIQAALRRGGAAKTRLNYPLYVDEVWVFLEHSDGKDFALALSQLRGFGVPTVYLHQALMQLGTYRELMRVSAGSRIIMRTKYPDSNDLAREYAAWGLTGTDISALNPWKEQYGVLRVNNTEYGPLSLEPQPWPEAVPDGTLDDQSLIASLTHRWRSRTQLAPWQQQLPPDSPDRALDNEVTRLVYGRHPSESVLIERCADNHLLSPHDWSLILDRWSAIRQWQRHYILHNQNAITDRFDRQRWLSRLLACHPRILSRIDYARTWHAIDAAAQQTAGKTEKIVVQRASSDGAGTTARTSGSRAVEVPRPLFAQVDDPVARPVAPMDVFSEDDDVVVP